MIQTITIILEQACLYVPLILGAYMSFSLLKVPDISIESAYVFGAILATKLLAAIQGMPTILVLISVLIASVVGGGVVGMIVALLTRVGKIPHLLASILTIGIFHGTSQFVLGGANVSLSPYDNPLAMLSGYAENPELPMLLLINILVIGTCYLFLKTQLGFCFAVYGNNPLFFDHHHISTDFIVAVALILSNGLAGLSGYFIAQSSGFVDINAGFGVPLFCITALIVGKVLAFRSCALISVSRPLLGLFAYCTIQQLLLKVGFNLKYFTMVQSILVILLIINAYRKRKTPKMPDALGV